MKINAKGSVTFSVRNDDKDLYELIANLPEGGGSDMIRALLRDGLAYQQLVADNTVPISYFNMLCQLKRLDADELLKPFNDYSPNKTATHKKTTRKRRTTNSKAKEATKPGEPPAEEPAEETTATPPPEPPKSELDEAFDSSFDMENTLV